MDNGDTLLGSTLGDYEILEVIGRGGMGIVYCARQRMLDRVVAIKVLLPELCSDPEYIARFLREARAAANLNHQNVIQIFDAGVVDDTYFFVMEYVDGRNLGQIIREDGRLEERDALHIVHQSAKGLSFAHSMGIIHRDVKPENLMISKTGAIKIGDLGLAKWKPDELDAGMTSSGTTMGTPYYISPEQIRAWEDIDARSDIYSLGMTLYHLLAGSPAFPTGTAPEIMAQHLSEEPPALRLLNPRVSQNAMDLFARMTVKKREHRIQEMAEVVDIAGEILGYPKDTTTRRHVVSTAMLKSNRSRGDLFNNLLETALRVVFVALIVALIALICALYVHNKESIKSVREKNILHRSSGEPDPGESR